MSDVAVVSDKVIMAEDVIHGTPDLVIEILSPSTAKMDRANKKVAYAKSSVYEYWIVDIKNFAIEVYRLQSNFLELYEVCMLLSKNNTKHLLEQNKHIPPTGFTTTTLSGVHIDLYEIFQDMIPKGY